MQETTAEVMYLQSPPIFVCLRLAGALGIGFFSEGLYAHALCRDTNIVRLPHTVLCTPLVGCVCEFDPAPNVVAGCPCDPEGPSACLAGNQRVVFEELHTQRSNGQHLAKHRRAARQQVTPCAGAAHSSKRRGRRPLWVSVHVIHRLQTQPIALTPHRTSGPQHRDRSCNRAPDSQRNSERCWHVLNKRA